MIKRLSLFMVTGLLLSTGLAAAQTPAIPTVPSVSGGIPGSPGMAGAATMPQVPAVPQPPVPQVQPPAFNPGNAQPPTFDPVASGGTWSTFIPSSSGERPGVGQIQGAGQGQRPRPGQGQAANTQQWGSSFAPFSQDASGQWSRFGDRGSGNIPLAQFSADGWAGWFESGGFGALAAAGDSPDLSSLAALAGDWHPANLPQDVPAAPAAFSDLTTVTTAQAAAQAAIQAAGGPGGANSAELQQNIQQTAQTAQQVYDQFWTDYYAAVDYAAAQYYAAVTASAEILLQTYEVALQYTLVAVDYYLAYYDQYAAYCYFYPWDCYMYAYDLATGVYYYVGDVSDTPVGTVTIGDVPVTTAAIPTTEPNPSAEAYKALMIFANDQLGAVVDPLYAGDATAQIELAISTLPPEIQAFALRAFATSCADYWGLLNGGAAGIMAGDCSAGTHPITLQTLNAELSSAATGAYMLYVNTTLPADASGALDLITTVYPALDGLAFAQITDIGAGQAFTATAAGLGIDPVTGQSLSVPKVIYTGVVDGGGVPLVYVLVGVGQPYVDLIATGQ